MWEMELNNKEAKGGKVIDPVGSEENWYNKANSYWMVWTQLLQSA